MHKCVNCDAEQEHDTDVDGRNFMWRDCDECGTRLSMKFQNGINPQCIFKCAHDGTLNTWQEIKYRGEGGNF